MHYELNIFASPHRIFAKQTICPVEKLFGTEFSCTTIHLAPIRPAAEYSFKGHPSLYMCIQPIFGPIYMCIRPNMRVSSQICVYPAANICVFGRLCMYSDDTQANLTCIYAKTELWQSPSMHNQIIWLLGTASEYSANIFGWGGFSQLQFGSDSVELYGRSNEYYRRIIRPSSTRGARYAR